MILVWKIKFCWFLLITSLARRRSKKLLKRYPFLSWSKKYYGYTNYDELPVAWRRNFGEEMLTSFDSIYEQMRPQERLFFQVDFEVNSTDGLLVTYGRYFDYCIFWYASLIDFQKYYNFLSKRTSVKEG